MVRRGETMSVIHLKDFPDDLHRALKIKAAETGTTIKALMMKYCEEGLKRDKGKKKGG
jgi:plasmid stability protein